MLKSLSCALTSACLMISMGACSPVQGIEAFNQDKCVLLQTEELVEGEDIAVVETSEGTFKMRFFPSEAPKTVENFIGLAQEKYFDGQKISAVEKIDQENRVKGRIIAGSGKPIACPGKNLSGEQISPEISCNLSSIPGAVVAYAPQNVVDSRFYIVGSHKVYEEELKEISENNYPKALVEMFRNYGGYPEDWLHEPVFAQVVEGMDVVDKIISQNEDTDKNDVTDIEIIRIEIKKYEKSGKNSGKKTVPTSIPLG